MKVGDELLWINGRHLIGLSHSEAVELLAGTSSVVQLVIARDAVSSLCISFCLIMSLVVCQLDELIQKIHERPLLLACQDDGICECIVQWSKF